MKYGVRIRRWLLLLALVAAIPVYAELNVWTSVSGTELEARFVGIENEQVILQPVEGDEVVIRLNLLVPTDQIRARELQADLSTAQADADGDDGEARLPTLADGPGRGHHAYYTHAHFDAWVRSNGRLYIHPKENGARVGQPIFVRQVIFEQVSGQPSARVYDFLDFNPPTVNPRNVTFEVLAKRDDKELTYTVEYTFEQNRVCASVEIISPRRSDRSFRARNTFRFGRVEEIPADMPQAERIQLLEHNVFRWRGGSARGWREDNFYDSLTLRGSIDDAEITGPWGARVVTFRGENRRSGNRTRVSNYSGRPLNDGYWLRHDVNLGARAGTCCITVE